MTDHADLIARLRASLVTDDYDQAKVDLLLTEAADALSRPAVTEEMIDALRRLLNFAGAAAFALEESETREDEVSVDLGMFGEAAAALERLEELPDDQPGYTMSGVAKAEWALRAILTDALGEPTSLQEAQGSPASARQPSVVGTIGHLDSGKRSLTAAIAMVLGDTAKPSPEPTGPGPETYPGHDPAAGLPQPDTAGGADASPGRRIIDGLKDALAGNFAAATIDGVRWVPDREASIRAEERERAATRMMGAYNEWYRLKNEQGERFAAWKRGGEEGPLPEFSLGSLPDYIAAAIRGGGND